MFPGTLTAAGGHGPLEFGSQAYLFSIASHSGIGCLSSVASGGKCGPGALSGGVSAAATPLVNMAFETPRGNAGDFIGGSAASGLVGGLASVAGGGKFENGAVTGAFGYMFNQAGMGHNGGPPLKPGSLIGGFLGKLAGALGAVVWTDDSTAINAGWGNQDTLQKHFEDHGKDFGATSRDDYAQKSVEFFLRSQSEGFPTKIDSVGTIRVYDPPTNTFGSYNPNGTTRTFFKPTSPGFWGRQGGNAPWQP